MLASVIADWRTSLVALVVVALLAAYLLGHLSEPQLLVALGTMTAVGKLLGADGARVDALARTLPVASKDEPAKGGES